MRLLALFIFVSGLSLLAGASPGARPDRRDDLRPAGTPGGLYACSLDRFAGACFYNSPDKVKSCSILTIGLPGDPTPTKPRSLGPEPGGHCDVFKGRICNDKTRVKRIDFPGVNSPAEVPEWDTIRCYDTMEEVHSETETALELLARSEHDVPQAKDMVVLTVEQIHVDVKSGQETASTDITSSPQTGAPGGLYIFVKDYFQGGGAYAFNPKECMSYPMTVSNPDGTVTTGLPESMFPEQNTLCKLYANSCSPENIVGTVDYKGLPQMPYYDVVKCCVTTGPDACFFEK